MVGVIASEATPAAMALKQRMQAASSASGVPGSEHMSEVSRHRLDYQPALPVVLRGEPACCCCCQSQCKRHCAKHERSSHT